MAEDAESLVLACIANDACLRPDAAGLGILKVIHRSRIATVTVKCDDLATTLPGDK